MKTGAWVRFVPDLASVGEPFRCAGIPLLPSPAAIRYQHWSPKPVLGKAAPAASAASASLRSVLDMQVWDPP